jgi:hypothetical protein
MKNVLKIIPDQDAESPRDWDNLGTMACWHSRYNLGDKDGVDKLKEAVRSSKKYRESWEDYRSDDYRDFDRPATLADTAEECGIYLLPLYLYDHSGITMSTERFSCPWDSGQVGVIFVTPEKVRAEFGKKRISASLWDKVSQRLKSEVKVYDQFIQGDVYGFVLEQDEEETDSCCGFYGSDPETNGMAEHLPVPLAQCEIVAPY